MATRVREHIRSNVWGIAAMFVALSGTAYASHPGGANTISTGDIINDQVFTQDLANNNMTSLDIRDDTLGSGGLQAIDLRADSVGTSEIADDAVTALEIAGNAVGPAEIVTDAVNSSEIAIDSVDADEIIANAVGTTEISSDAVNSSKIINGGVSNTDIATAAVGSDELSNLFQAGGNLVDFGDQTQGNGSYLSGISIATCPADSQVISGGGDWDTNAADQELAITESAPTSNGWRVVAISDEDDVDFRATALCLNLGTG